MDVSAPIRLPEIETVQETEEGVSWSLGSLPPTIGLDTEVSDELVLAQVAQRDREALGILFGAMRGWYARAPIARSGM